MAIEELVVRLSKDPFNAKLNFACALEYERINQTASAVSFCLRAAEYGVNQEDPDIVYTSLLKMAHCFEDQNNRVHSVSNALLQAIAFYPERPEGYFLMSQFHERQGNWQECYTWAAMGEPVAFDYSPLPADVGYLGDYCLIFEKAVSAYWIGRLEESISLLKELLTMPLSSEYRAAVNNNLNRLGIEIDSIDPLEPVVTNYRKFFGSIASLIIDIGTRDGDDANYLFKALNGNKVIAIDANPDGAELTKFNYPWMDVQFTAVADTNGSTTFHQVSSDNKELVGCSSIFSKETAMYPEDFANNTKPITVPLTRMDTLLENTHGLIDVVKVDTEGYTWQVLQGFGERLKDVKLLHLETERDKLHDSHVTYEEVTAFMEANGFALVDVSYEWGWGIQDQVWVNKALAQRNLEVFRQN